MARIVLQQFSGEVPRVDPFYLPDAAASDAMNAQMLRGTLAPFRALGAEEHTFGAAMTAIYLHNAEWLGWNHDVDVVPGPVAQDRLYITHGNAQPTLWNDGTEIPLRLPNPTTRPIIARTGDLDTDNAESVVYAYTWVTSLGEESGPSPLSNRVLWSPDNNITLSSMPATPPIAGRLITKKRIYRAVTGASGVVDLYFVAEINLTDITFIHDLDTHPIAEALATKEFDPAPNNLRGLTAMPNGMMAGFAGKEVFFCEPYQPHAWPEAYKLAVNDTIIGLAAFGTTLAVLTTGQPYIVQGMHPESMAMQKMEQPFPCMAKRAIVDMGYSAIYPSTDGLVSVSENGAQLMTKALWTRDQWLAMQPTTMIAGRVGNLYAFSYTPLAGGGSRHVVLLDPSGEQAVLRSDEVVQAFYTHVESGKTFVLGSDRTAVRELHPRDTAKKTMRWRSKEYRLGHPTSFGAIRIETDDAAGETAQARIYANGELLHTVEQLNATARLPPGTYRNWQIEIAGNATVLRVVMASSIVELND